MSLTGWVGHACAPTSKVTNAIVSVTSTGTQTFLKNGPYMSVSKYLPVIAQL